MHRALQWSDDFSWKIGWTSNSQKKPHILPSWAGYGLVYCGHLEKNGVITGATLYQDQEHESQGIV